MRILVGWDDPSEAELLSLYLSGGGENEAIVAGSAEEFLSLAEKGYAEGSGWDAVFVPIHYPDSVDAGFRVFCRIHELLPGIPVVSACRPAEMISLPRFL